MDGDILVPMAIKEPKPPPIFLPGVPNISPLIRALDTMVPKAVYAYKCVNQYRTKLFPTSSNDYREIVSGLTRFKARVHTNQLKQARTYKIALNDIHYSTCIEDLRFALK